MAKYLDLDGLTRYNNKVNTKLGTKADTDGNYEDMAVGQLLSNTFEEDKAPYNFRTAGGTLEIGDREYDTLVGGTVAFNQLFDFTENSTRWKNNGSITRTWNNGVLTLSNGVSAAAYSYQEINEITNHCYLYIATGKTTQGEDVTSLGSLSIYKSGATTDITKLFETTKTTVSGIWKAQSNFTNNMQLRPNNNANTLEVYNVLFVDLTQMFGSTIADYIYSLEQATAGSGVAYFRSLFPKDYYAYNAGQLMSVKALSHKMVGFNQWDEEWESGAYDSNGNKSVNVDYIRSKNFITVLPNTTYYFKVPTAYSRVCFYDSNKGFIERSNAFGNDTFVTPSNCNYATFFTQGNTYQNNICINFHWDGERDGEYEAYSEHIYPLDSDLELRGIPKLDANNNLYYDGDTYESDGTVTRKYGVVDLGSATFVKNVSYEHIFNLELPVGKRAYDTLSAIFIYPQYTSSDVANYDYGYAIAQGKHIVYFKDKDANTVEDFKTKMQGQIFIYKVDTPFTETADTFENPQLVDNWGTEEYTDSRAVQIPVGHITKYPRGIKSLMAIMEQEIEEAKELPAVTSTDEGKVLTVDSNGNWVAGNIPDGSNTSY